MSKRKGDVSVSWMPLGMISGTALGVLFGIFFPKFLLLAICVGVGLGYLVGVIAYAVSSGKGN